MPKCYFLTCNGEAINDTGECAKHAAETKRMAKAGYEQYCPYDRAWMPFEKHHYMSSIKCCGCSRSTNDFWIRKENGLFGGAK